MTVNNFVQLFRIRQCTQTFILPSCNLYFVRDKSLLPPVGLDYKCCFSTTVHDSFPEDFGVDTTT